MAIIYFAGRYSRAEQLRKYRDDIHALGYIVSSRWLDHHGGALRKSLDKADIESDIDYANAIAAADLQDLEAADMIVAFTEEEPGGKGGRHFELGYAVRAKKRIILIGPRENVFHALPFMHQFPSWSDFISYARRINATSSDQTWSAEATAPDGQGGEGGPAVG